LSRPPQKIAWAFLDHPDTTRVEERLDGEVRAVHEKLTSSESAYNKHEDDKHGMNRTIIFCPAFSQNQETLSLGRASPALRPMLVLGSC
jgi:hypothetical protein